MAKITGIGGVFFKSRSDHKELAAWYHKNLGMPMESWGGTILEWSNDKAGDGGQTVWSTAAKDSKWFSPSESSFMINYRVDNLDEMLDQLKANGVEDLRQHLKKYPEEVFSLARMVRVSRVNEQAPRQVAFALQRYQFQPGGVTPDSQDLTSDASLDGF